MKIFTHRYIPIVLLALVLMLLIFITQMFTNQTTLALKQGNLQAVETFKINNRMQELVNIAFDLQAKFRLSAPASDERKQDLVDSLTLLEYNSNALMKAAANKDTRGFLEKLNTYIVRQVNLSLQILESGSRQNTRQPLVDSLRRMQLGDSIYTNCLEVQKLLEKDLQDTLIRNTAQANKLSLYNRVLAVAAILAILVMTTIIVRRHARQLQLISDLKEAQKAAQRSTEAKDQFLANMSHELRTPLNALVGFGQLLSQTELDEKQQQYVSIITSSSYNLLNIVNDVLDLSKIEAGKMRIERKVFELRDILEDIHLMFSTALTEKGLQYTSDIDNKIPRYLKSDPERLKQILINLIGNAIKFTSQGAVYLGVSIVWDNAESNKVKIAFSVRDTGAGIPADKIESIFQRFEQLEHATTRQHGGTGLGLTIVKNLVSMLGGNISVHSDLGRGSVFTFTTLFEKVSEEEAAENNGPASSAYIDLSPFRILAVEDNRTNQLLLDHLMRKYHASVQFADNGEEALTAISKNDYDLILMDIQMPVMDGYVAADQIRRDRKLTIPMIAMTAYVSREEQAKCMEAGFNAYIGKPIEEKKLVEAVLELLPGAGAAMVRDKDDNSYDYLLQLIAGDREMAKEIIAEMQQQWQKDCSELEAAVKKANQAGIKSLLHRMRSTFSPLGPRHPVFVQISDIEKLLLQKGKNTQQTIAFIDELNKLVDGLGERLNAKNS
ncbi:response regulator [Nostoc ellipsosporum NOK]|nr:response regulator [Nostoc ellipsosporum NOK]